ncbi:Retrovirus-related Pol polyprotein from transposon RE1 [Linum perenne]
MVRSNGNQVPPPMASLSLDQDHPYHIGTGDNPGILLVNTVLVGAADYFAWVRSMRMALMAKNKIGFVDGTEMAPEASDPSFAAWRRANVLVLGWILKAVSAEIAQSVLWLDSARDVWMDLQERFSRSNLVRINDLHDQISSFRQGALSVSSYYTRFKVLWDEFAMFRPVPSCTCQPRCSCVALVTVREYFRTEQIIRFLRGLNPSFSGVRSQIIRSDPLPTINTVFSMVVQEEQEHVGGRGEFTAAQQAAGVLESSAPRAFAASTSSSGQGFKKGKRPLCTHCGLIGHTIDKCYKRNGYPPGYRTKKVVNSVQATPSAPESQTQVAVEDVHQDADTVSITRDQYQTLYSLFQGHSSAGDALGAMPSALCVTSTTGVSTSMPSTSANEPYVPTVAAAVPSNSKGKAVVTDQSGHQDFQDDWYS